MGQQQISYQGSKTRLLDEIISTIKELQKNSTVLDLFGGSGVVSDALQKEGFRVFSNDVEKYSAILLSGILKNNLNEITDTKLSEFLSLYEKHKNHLTNKSSSFLLQEKDFIKSDSPDCLKELYNSFPTIWNNTETITAETLKKKNAYDLTLHYFATSYFSIRDAIDIDAIRFAIDNFDSNFKDSLLSVLIKTLYYFSFSRDGHFAQPLSVVKDFRRFKKLQSKSVIEVFISILEKDQCSFSGKSEVNMVFNENFTTLLESNEIKGVDVIYADPPYTDMQYSRYYHLLNVIVKYEYPEPSRHRNSYSVGRYTDGRFSSNLSKKSKALDELTFLFEYCKKYNIRLVLSYAYPENTLTQKTDRYVFSISSLTSTFKKVFGEETVDVKEIQLTHSNHRNPTVKRVIEYLLIYKGSNT